jgi:hypothetical protein
MANIQIPEHYKEGFNLISKLSEIELGVICEKISLSKHSHKSEDLINEYFEDFHFPKDSLSKIIKTIISLLTLKYNSEVSDSELVNDLIQAYSPAGARELRCAGARLNAVVTCTKFKSKKLEAGRVNNL